MCKRLFNLKTAGRFKRLEMVQMRQPITWRTKGFRYTDGLLLVSQQATVKQLHEEDLWEIRVQIDAEAHPY